jgi:hypothetical protein
MKKIISIMLIGMMTIGCGMTAILDRLGREREAQAADQENLEGRWERFSTYVYNNTFTYFFGTIAVLSAFGFTAYFYHVYKKTVENGNGIPEVEDSNNHPEEKYQEEEQHDPLEKYSEQAISEDMNFVADDNLNEPNPKGAEEGLPNNAVGGEETFLDFKSPTDSVQTEYPRVEVYRVAEKAQAPANNPQQMLNLLNELFVPHAYRYHENTFNPAPILMLTYDPKPESDPKVNKNQQIDIQQHVAEYVLMKTNHIEPIIVEVNQSAQKSYR